MQQGEGEEDTEGLLDFHPGWEKVDTACMCAASNAFNGLRECVDAFTQSRAHANRVYSSTMIWADYMYLCCAVLYCAGSGAMISISLGGEGLGSGCERNGEGVRERTRAGGRE